MPKNKNMEEPVEGALAPQCPVPLHAGELGVLAAPAGMGKTACLVQFALAELLAGRSVVHIGLKQTVLQVREWYDRLLSELRRGQIVEVSDDLRMQMERRRHIHSYLTRGFHAESLSDALIFLRDVMDFRPDLVVVDGFALEDASKEEVKGFEQIAKAHAVPMWLTCLTQKEDKPNAIPGCLLPLSDPLSTILQLDAEEQRIWLTLTKHKAQLTQEPLPLWLNPTTFLFHQK